MLLGDSFVEGACVSPSDNLASQLNKITNEAVLNLGQAGFGPLSQLGTYLEYVSTKKIKNIFWFYYEENDTIDLIHEKNNTLSNYLYLDGFSQKLTDDKVNSLKDSIVKKFSKIRLARIKNSYNHDNNNFIKIKKDI